MTATSRAVVDDFLAQKRIAFVGVSRNGADFSRKLWDELRRRGYDLVPVNPEAAEIDGVPCVARLTAIEPKAEAALLLVPSETTNRIVRDCDAAGIRRVWMYRAAGRGALNEEAAGFCAERGIAVVPGECPFMFLPGSGGVHPLHGWWRKVTGKYPA